MQNCPPRSPDLSPLDFHVCGYMKSMVYERKVDKSDKLLQRIFDAVKRVNELQIFIKLYFPWSNESGCAFNVTAAI